MKNTRTHIKPTPELSLQTLLELRSPAGRQALQGRLRAAQSAGYQQALTDVRRALDALQGPRMTPAEKVVYDRLQQLVDLRAHECRVLGVPSE